MADSKGLSAHLVYILLKNKDKSNGKRSDSLSEEVMTLWSNFVKFIFFLKNDVFS